MNNVLFGLRRLVDFIQEKLERGRFRRITSSSAQINLFKVVLKSLKLLRDIRDIRDREGQ